jgi:hypothetical protein
LKYISPKFFSLLLLSFLTQLFASEVDAIAAVVDDKVITNLDVAHLKSFMLIQGKLSSDNLTEPGLSKSLLNLGIERKLMLHSASGPDIDIPDSDKLLEYFLKFQKLDSSGLQVLLDANDLDKESFVSFLEEDFLIQQSQNHYLSGKVFVSDSNAKDYITTYNNDKTRYHVLDFYVQKDEDKLTAASFSTMINNAVKNYNAGIEVSAPVTVNDLGTRVLNDFPELYRNVVLNIKGGVASYMVIADNGYHALLLQDRQMPVALSTQDAKQILYSQEAGKTIVSWLNELRKTTYIKII